MIKFLTFSRITKNFYNFLKNYLIFNKFQTLIYCENTVTFMIYSKYFTKKNWKCLKFLKFYFWKVYKNLSNFCANCFINFSKFLSLMWVNIWWMLFPISNSVDATGNYVQCLQSNQNSGDAPGVKELKGTQAPQCFWKLING